MRQEIVAKFRKCEIVKEYINAEKCYALYNNGHFICRDKSFKWLNQIMYQIG